jgi:predicted ribosome quality control (RQC) complex YloA/Tae2 family protein
MPKIITYISDHDKCEYKIQIGTNDKDNWYIIDSSDENDIWFHVSEHPSAHIILSLIDSNVKKPHRSVLKYCSQLCKTNSKLKSHKNVSISYTKIKDITKAKKTGSVIIKNEKYIKI